MKLGLDTVELEAAMEGLSLCSVDRGTGYSTKNCGYPLNSTGQDGKVHLAQDWDQWRALMNVVMNLRVPYKTGNFLTS
jgi:hypothetical protein